MIYQTILRTINKYKMLDGVKSVLLGFSGGADSTALLHCMAQLDITLYAVHVNHCIRGDEAMRDQHFCEDFCREHDIKLFVETKDIPQLSKLSGMSVEETARDERYRIFERLRGEYNIDRIATAHNSGDNIETVIFNMTRGAALRGLCGIPPVRGDIIRPLIECSKADIIAYCEDNGLGYVTDSTNNETIYTRNFIRSAIIPQLRAVNPAAETAVTRMTKLLRTDDNFITAEADKLPETMSVTELAALHDSLLSRRLIRMCGGYIGGDHINALMELIRAGGNTSVSLPDNIIFKIAGDTVSFEKYTKTERKFIPETILKHGENYVPGTDSMVFITDNEKDIKPIKNIYKLFIHKVLNFDKIVGYIYIRSRKNGDRYVFGGMNRNVKKLLCDRHIPVNERDSLPFICDDNGILWIPGFDIRDDLKGGTPLYVAYYKGEHYDNP